MTDSVNTEKVQEGLDILEMLEGERRFSKAIIEGPSGCGKSYLARQMADPGYAIVQWAMLQSNGEENLRVGFMELMNLPMPLVFDCSPISTYVYSKYAERSSWFSSRDVIKLVESEVHGRCGIGIGLPKLDVLRDVCDRIAYPAWIVNNLEAIWTDYHILADALGKYSNVTTFDKTEQLKEALERADDSNSGL